MSATRPPRVSSCRLTASAPSSSTRPIRGSGSGRAGPRTAAQGGLVAWVANAAGAWAPCRAAASPRRPRALSTRMPRPPPPRRWPGRPAGPEPAGTAPGSGCSNRRRSARPAQHGPAIRPSHQFRWISRATTVKKVGDVGDQEDRAEPGEPADRRQVGGGPGQQLAGLPGAVEAGGSRCRCAYRSSRMSRSMVVTALAMAQRRRKFSVAWADAQGDGRGADRQQQRTLAVADRAVDNRLGQQRDDDLGAHRHQRGGEHEHQLPPIGAQVAAGAPECGEGRSPGRRLRARAAACAACPVLACPVLACPVLACTGRAGVLEPGCWGGISRTVAASFCYVT